MCKSNSQLKPELWFFFPVYSLPTSKPTFISCASAKFYEEHLRKPSKLYSFICPYYMAPHIKLSLCPYGSFQRSIWANRLWRYSESGSSRSYWTQITANTNYTKLSNNWLWPQRMGTNPVKVIAASNFRPINVIYLRRSSAVEMYIQQLFGKNEMQQAHHLDRLVRSYQTTEQWLQHTKVA